MDKSYTTATRLGLEHIQVITPAIDDEDDISMLCGADYRNRVVWLVWGESTFEIHQSDLKATIQALTKLVEE